MAFIMTRLARIVYTSHATSDLTQEEIQSLTAKAAKANHAAGITGVLLFGGRRFIQLIEGDPLVIETLFREKIIQDARHINCEILLRESIDERLCPNWSMGCLYITDDDTTKQQAWDQFSQAIMQSRRYNLLSNDAAVRCIAEFIQSFGDEVDQATMAGWLTSIRGLDKAS